MTSDDFRVSKSIASDLSRWIDELTSLSELEEKVGEYCHLVKATLGGSNADALSSAAADAEDLFSEAVDLIYELKTLVQTLEGGPLESEDFESLKIAAFSLLRSIGDSLPNLQSDFQSMARAKLRKLKFPSAELNLEPLEARTEGKTQEVEAQLKAIRSSIDQVIDHLRQKSEEYEMLASKRIV
jgi:hypothetical protein